MTGSDKKFGGRDEKKRKMKKGREGRKKRINALKIHEHL